MVCLRKSARSAGDFLGFLVCRLIEYSHVNILPQITQITQRGMQQAALSRRERQIGLVVSFMWFCCFGVCLRKSARSAGDIGVSFVWID